MRIDRSVLDAARPGERWERHGAPNPYGGRPVVARVTQDQTGPGSLIAEWWEADDGGIVGAPRRVAGPAALVLASLGKLARADGWVRVFED